MSTTSTHMYYPSVRISLAAKTLIWIGFLGVAFLASTFASPQINLDLKAAFSTAFMAAPVAPANPATPAQPAIGSDQLNVTPATNPVPAAAPAAPVKAPAAPAPAPTRLDGMKAVNGNYTTKGGDTLGQIAAANGKSVAHLASVNGIGNPNTIPVGMTLKMDGPPKPQSNPSPAASGAPQASSNGGVSIVRGVVTSGFGSRWGTKHYGLDIAAPIGTPIHTPLAGTVISSGPASGFGLWVRVRHADGTITVYGHINRSFVTVGQQVSAGQKIAEVGNRGQSTGSHLHIEVIDPSGTKINPKPWLDANGFQYT